MMNKIDLSIFDIENLNEWAGEKIVERGRNYQRNGAVEELVLLEAGCMDGEGRMGAVVRGTHAYRLAVDFDEGGIIESRCTCPYEYDCKHAAAAIFEYLHRLESGRDVPLSEDAKYARLMDGDDYGDSADVDMPAIEAWLHGQSVKALADLLLDICRIYPDIATDLGDRLDAARGDTAGLMQKIRQQANTVMDGPDWEYNDYDSAADYSKLLKTMERALPLGVADELLDVMDNVLEAVQEQTGYIDDDYFAVEAAECYAAAVKILRASTLTPMQKLLWAIAHILADQYDIDEALHQYLEERHAPDSWSGVADKLLSQLQKQAASENYKNWERDQLSKFAIHALEKSGRDAEIIPLCEQEAPLTMSYERLVSRLLKAGRFDEAERYIALGVAITCAELPGIAASLRRLRTEIYFDRADWPRVLIYHVCEFVESESTNNYAEVEKVAARIQLWPQVRTLLLEYLQSGVVPWQQPGWNLPMPDQVELSRGGRGRNEFPKVEVLIEIAIMEKDPAEVVRGYERLPKDNTYWYDRLELKVAEAVKSHAPDLALAIWKKLAEAEIARTKPAAYHIAGTYLRKIKNLMTGLKREPEWCDYLIRLRTVNVRKKRLLEVLNAL